MRFARNEALCVSLSYKHARTHTLPYVPFESLKRHTTHHTPQRPAPHHTPQRQRCNAGTRSGSLIGVPVYGARVTHDAMPTVFRLSCTRPCHLQGTPTTQPNPQTLTPNPQLLTYSTSETRTRQPASHKGPVCWTIPIATCLGILRLTWISTSIYISQVPLSQPYTPNSHTPTPNLSPKPKP